MDAGEGGVLPDCLDPDAYRVVRGHCPGDHSVAGLSGHGFRFSGDHRLVHLHLAGDDLSVGRYPPARSNEHDVADRQFPDRHRLGPVVDDPFRFIGKQLGKGCEGSSSLADGPHLHPVTQEHDRYQSCKLPPELEVEPAESGCRGRHEGDGDRHPYEQHHPRLTVPDLLDRALQERGSAVEEDDSSQHGGNPVRSRERGGGVAEPLLDHLAEEHHRNGEGQR